MSQITVGDTIRGVFDIDPEPFGCSTHGTLRYIGGLPGDTATNQPRPTREGTWFSAGPGVDEQLLINLLVPNWAGTSTLVVGVPFNNGDGIWAVPNASGNATGRALR